MFVYYIYISCKLNALQTLPILISVSGLFLELSSCLRFPAEDNIEDQALRHHHHPSMYSANQLVLSVENRDSMALLAAIFTGIYL